MNIEVNPEINLSHEVVQNAIKQIQDNNYLPEVSNNIIAVGMSGGVDSSVSAGLLKAMGYNIIGVTGWLTDTVNSSCEGARDVAANVAKQLDIPHHIVDLRKMFEPTIMSPFIESYKQGRTPVPCMSCNTEIKWGSLLGYSKKLDATHFASGHYVRLVKHNNTNNNLFSDSFSIGKPHDDKKDQSYMLWTLSQEQMSRAIFPLANFSKDYIREIAEAMGLFNANRAESQDICFVPNKTKDFLQSKIGKRVGDIQHIHTNEIMGQHEGVHLYTVGQRKGLGIAHPTPLYVVKINALKNIVYIGGEEDLYSSGLIAEHLNWQCNILDSVREFTALVKIRYASEPVRSTIKLTENNSMHIQFETPQTSVTPGQAAVIYDLDFKYIIGGGWISQSV